MNLYVFIACLLLSAVVSGSGAWYTCDLRWENEVTKRENAEIKSALDKTKSLQETVASLRNELKKERDNAKIHTDKLRDRINTGDLRLSVPAASCTTDTSGDPGVSDGGKRCELSGPVSNALIDIAEEGDTAIREFRELKLICEEIRDACYL